MPLLLLLLLSLSQLVCAEIRLLDDNGDELVLAQPAQRIISLAPNITEVLFHIGAGEQIVGADEYSNYPEAAK
ncbi:MAG: cobalamin-binding protein, partial [Porticoccaceae bacterium]